MLGVSALWGALRNHENRDWLACALCVEDDSDDESEEPGVSNVADKGKGEANSAGKDEKASERASSGGRSGRKNVGMADILTQMTDKTALSAKKALGRCLKVLCRIGDLKYVGLDARISWYLI